MVNTPTQLQEMGLFLIRSLDSAKKTISQVVPTETGAIIHYKNATTAPVKVSANLSPALFCDGYVIIKNTKENVQIIIDNWEKALSFEKMILLFLDEKTGNRWLLRPNIHAKIAEPKTLAQGLMTLFEHSMEKA